MLKTLLLIRHAKSSWDSADVSDFERPLNKRGHTDAPAMAKKLLKEKVAIDCFVSSTANRALTTATYFAEVYGKTPNDIILQQNLYHAPPSTIVEVIEQTPDNVQHLAIFCHNPGITQFVNLFTDVQIDNVPTCGIFALQIHTQQWAQFAVAKKNFLFFYYPKALL